METILYQSADVLAVNKPEGIASIPENDLTKESLFSRMTAQLGAPLFVVHRLDKEVSGVILFARNAEAHKFLNDQFAGREIRKSYLALVHGDVKEESGAVEKPIREFGSGRMGVDSEKGKESVTEFCVVERMTDGTLVRAFPHTGRRHQIRVHLYSIGHPVAGDLRYGERTQQEKVPRLMLHAERITFRVMSGDSVTVEAPLPASFLAVLDQWRKRS